MPRGFRWGARKKTHSFMLTPFTIDLLASIALRTKTSGAECLEVWSRVFGE